MNGYYNIIKRILLMCVLITSSAHAQEAFYTIKKINALPTLATNDRIDKVSKYIKNSGHAVCARLVMIKNKEGGDIKYAEHVGDLRRIGILVNGDYPDDQKTCEALQDCETQATLDGTCLFVDEILKYAEIEFNQR
jgi:hypothetical protein